MTGTKCVNQKTKRTCERYTFMQTGIRQSTGLTLVTCWLSKSVGTRWN